MTEAAPDKSGKSSILQFLPLGLFLLLAVGFLIALYMPGRDVVPSQFVGEPAPEFSVESLRDGEAPLDAAALATGEPIVLNFFASWCPPCRAEHPYLTEIANSGVPVYAIAYKDKPANTRIFLDRLGDPFTRIGNDSSGRVGINWGLVGVPETFVLNGEGRIVYKHPGPINPGELESKILPAIEGARN